MTAVEPAAPPVEQTCASGTTRRTALLGAASTLVLVGAASRAVSAGAPAAPLAPGPFGLTSGVGAPASAMVGASRPPGAASMPAVTPVPPTTSTPVATARSAVQAGAREADTMTAPSTAAPSTAAPSTAQAAPGQAAPAQAQGSTPAPQARPPKPSMNATGSGTRRSYPSNPSHPPGPVEVGGYALVAAAAKPVPTGAVSVTDPVRTLLRKASFGYTPSELARARQMGIDAWIEEQLDPALADRTGDEAWAMFPLAGASTVTVRATVARYKWDAMYETAQGALARQIYSRRQLFEVLVDVFHNRLHVPIPAEVWSIGPDYYQQVIRRHALGTYEDMLLAAMRHPAMLRYLSNEESTRAHVNENLGRELLELHTVGVDAGFTEDEVKASAAILSGRTIDRNDQFTYDSRRHAVTPVRVLGFQSANSSESAGMAVGDAYLRHLARHPQTALSVSRTLARRFVSDNPPPALLEEMAATYLSSGTSIAQTLRTMFRSPLFWSSAGKKVNRAHEDMLATVRILTPIIGDGTKASVVSLYWASHESGMPVLGWDPPNGYPDVAAAWLSAGALMARWNLHRKVVRGWFGGLGLTLAEQLVPDAQSLTVQQFVERASLRILDQPLTPADLAAVVAVTGFAPTQVVQWRLPSVANSAVPLLLDSIYFQVR